MRGLIFFVLSAASFSARSHSLEGVYAGRILSQKNAFVISVVQATAIESVYMSTSEKLVFMGSVRGVHLEGTAQSNNVFLEINGRLVGDSLFLNVKQNGEIQLRKLKRISRMTNYNTAKLLKSGASRNLAQVGSWALLDAFGRDGKKKPKDEFSNGFMYKFFADGSCVIQSQAINKFFNEVKAQPHKSYWDVDETKLIISTRGVSSLSYDYSFVLKGDTLSLFGKSSKEVYVRVRGKQSVK